MEAKQKQFFEIYFSNYCDLDVIRIDANSIGIAKIEDGFLKIFDKVDNGWHCYNISTIRHFHYPPFVAIRT